MAELAVGAGHPLRALAFYLPQFHATRENDAFWGRGFTEWTNVTRARPVFDGHQQPHLPADLGFYDLRVPETRTAQAQLARAHGLHGFVYYHYWFHGRRLLERPIDDVLATRSPDFPFCLCWANEHWTRRWDGLDAEVLVEQRYSTADDLVHLRWLAGVFDDPRYIRVNGKPLFLVYRASRLPDPLVTTTTWREEARRLGIGELYLCRVESFPTEKCDPVSIGFDASVEFQPDSEHLGPSRAEESHRVFDYGDAMRRMLSKPPVTHRRYPGVTPSWDNVARRRHGATILADTSPELYEQWLARVVSRFVPYSPDENLLFINAWNEWGEGNHLEPCQRWGTRYLEATARALGSATPLDSAVDAAVQALRSTLETMPLPAPVRDVNRELFLVELYNLASQEGLGGDRSFADAIFRVVCDLAQPVSESLAGKAYFKRSQLVAEHDARALLERALELSPEHLEARRRLDAMAPVIAR